MNETTARQATVMSVEGHGGSYGKMTLVSASKRCWDAGLKRFALAMSCLLPKVPTIWSRTNMEAKKLINIKLVHVHRLFG